MVGRPRAVLVVVISVRDSVLVVGAALVVLSTTRLVPAGGETDSPVTEDAGGVVSVPRTVPPPRVVWACAALSPKSVMTPTRRSKEGCFIMIELQRDQLLV
jgi:hypothetical protein